MVSAARKGGGQNIPCAQLTPVCMSIGRHSIYNAFVNIYAQFLLIQPDKIEAILLRDSPCLTDILLIEVCSEKDVIRLYIWGTNEKVVAIKLSHADMNVLIVITWCILLNSLIEDGRVSTKLASGEKEHIVQCRIERVSIRDVLQRWTMVAIQDDVLRTSDLISITWQDDCNLPDSSIRLLIAEPITTFIKAQGNVTLMLWRHSKAHMISPLVEGDTRM